MSQARSVATPALTPETERELDALDRAFKSAVQKARAENRRRGIPNVQVEMDGQLTEELPDGTIRPIAAEAKPSRS